jgi:hypothetical protein
MMLRRRLRAPLLFASVLLLRLTAANTSEQTVASVPAFKHLDPCAQGCFFNIGSQGAFFGNLEGAIGCSWNYQNPGINDCYCRTDKQPVATSYLSSCIANACTVGNPSIDINSGVGIYVGYCQSLGYLTPGEAPATVSATATQAEGVGTTADATGMAC